MPTPLPLAPFTPGEEDRPPTHMLRMMLVVASNDDDVSSPYCGLPQPPPIMPTSPHRVLPTSCPPHRVLLIVSSLHRVLPIVSSSLCPCPHRVLLVITVSSSQRPPHGVLPPP